MREHSLLCGPDPMAAETPHPTPKLRLAQVLATVPDAAEEMGLFGRWWCDTQTGQWVLSPGAARLLDVGAGFCRTETSCFRQVVRDDGPALSEGVVGDV